MFKPDNSTGLSKEMPAYITLDKWLDNNFFWSGQLAVGEFQRLAENIIDTKALLQVECSLVRKEGILRLVFDVAGEGDLPCQRCLSSLKLDLSGIYQLALVEDKTQLSQLTDMDYLFLDEIVITKGKKRILPIKDLLEDELLLMLPSSAKHDDCEMMVTANQDNVEDIKENPFDVLMTLKIKQS